MTKAAAIIQVCLVLLNGNAGLFKCKYDPAG